MWRKLWHFGVLAASPASNQCRRCRLRWMLKWLYRPNCQIWCENMWKLKDWRVFLFFWSSGWTFGRSENWESTVGCFSTRDQFGMGKRDPDTSETAEACSEFQVSHFFAFLLCASLLFLFCKRVGVIMIKAFICDGFVGCGLSQVARRYAGLINGFWMLSGSETWNENSNLDPKFPVHILWRMKWNPSIPRWNGL